MISFLLRIETTGQSKTSLSCNYRKSQLKECYYGTTRLKLVKIFFVNGGVTLTCFSFIDLY